MNRNQLAGIVLFTAISLGSKVKTFAQNENPIPTTTTNNSYTLDQRENLTSNVPLNEISSIAYRRFKKEFPSVDGESWIKTNDGYVVNFSERDSIFNHIYYSKKGEFIEQISYFSAVNTPLELAQLVKNCYPDFIIHTVTKIRDNLNTIFGLVLSKGKLFKTITLHNGSIEETNEFYLSNQ